MLTYIRTDSSNEDFRSLVSLLDRDLAERDGSDHAFYAQFNKIENIRNVVVAYEDGNAVAICAFKAFAPGLAEIKRMFVLRERRRSGFGLQLLGEVEKWATECGYNRCVLETGKRQPEAIALYRRAGYGIVPNYGPYKDQQNSVCLSKEIGSGKGPD